MGVGPDVHFQHPLVTWTALSIGFMIAVLNGWGNVIYRWIDIFNTFPTIYNTTPDVEFSSRKSKKTNLQLVSDYRLEWLVSDFTSSMKPSPTAGLATDWALLK